MENEQDRSVPNWNPIRNIILPDAKQQPDRSLAIVIAAVVEDHLGQALINLLADDRKAVNDMFRGTGPLATFSAKINLGRLIGLYDRQLADMLHSIRKIRNMFAHEMVPIDFQTPSLADRMEPLATVVNRHHTSNPLKGRDLYIAGCEYLMGALMTLEAVVVRLEHPLPTLDKPRQLRKL